MHFTLCTSLYALHSMRFTLCSSLHALHSMRFTLCPSLYALRSMHFTLCTSLYVVGSEGSARKNPSRCFREKNEFWSTKNKCQETHWAPKTHVRKLVGLSNNMNMNFGQEARGTFRKNKMNFGRQNKCQEIFWALQRHEFWAPTTNVRKLAGISKKTCVLDSKNKSQETRLVLKQPVQEFCAPKANVRASKTNASWAPKTNVRKPTGLSKKHEF